MAEFSERILSQYPGSELLKTTEPTPELNTSKGRRESIGTDIRDDIVVDGIVDE